MIKPQFILPKNCYNYDYQEFNKSYLTFFMDCKEKIHIGIFGHF